MSGLRLTEGSRGTGASVAVEGAPLTRTQVPYVTGSSVLGIKCADGVVIACDTMGTFQRVYGAGIPSTSADCGVAAGSLAGGRQPGAVIESCGRIALLCWTLLSVGRSPIWEKG